MARPGTNVLIRDLPPPRSFATDTGRWFVCGEAQRGPTQPVLIRSLAEFVDRFGVRLSYSLLYDALDVFFREGGNGAYVSRVVAPAAAKASHNLMDTAVTPAISLVVKAKDLGAWGNDLSVQVAGAAVVGYFQLIVSYQNVVVERSLPFADQASAVAWSQHSDYIDVTLGASALNPDEAPDANLTGGTDDRSNIGDAQWDAALGRFDKGLGPGQVSYPGRTSTNAHEAIITHASENRRVAVLDLPDTGDKASLITAAAAARAVSGSRFAVAFAPWAVVPGVIPGTTRVVPYSAVECGIIARNDARLTPDDPAAGDRGQSNFATGLSQPGWDDIDREDLNDASVNVARMMFGGVRTYGYRSLTDPNADPSWIDFGNARMVMRIAADGEQILENHMFEKIDGQGRLFGQVDGELSAMLGGWWARGALYGATAAEAYNVDTGPAVNTPITIADNELHAVLAVKISPMAEYIVLELVKVHVASPIA